MSELGEQTIPVLKAFQFAFEMIRKNYLLIGYLCLARAMLQVLGFIPSYVYPKTDWLSTVLMLVLILPYTIIHIQMVKVGLKGYGRENKAISFREIGYPDNTLFWKYIIITFVQGLLMILGMLMLLIPMFVVITTYLFIFEALVDSGKEIKARRVFSISEKLTDGIKWKLLGYITIITIPLIFNFLLTFNRLHQRVLWKDIVVILIASFLVFPIENLSRAYLYKHLKQQE